MTQLESPPKHNRVLIVDDDLNTRRALEKALELMGADVLLAGTGEEALAALSDPRVGVVLLDLELPDLHGLDVLRHIEANRPGVRVVIITAHGTVEGAVQSMKLGALDVIQKPFSLEGIRRLVRHELDEALRDAEQEERYFTHVERARTRIREYDFDGALEHLKQASCAREDGPEALNLRGVVEQVRGSLTLAQKHWRMALMVDPTYRPAKENLRRSATVPRVAGPLDLG